MRWLLKLKLFDANIDKGGVFREHSFDTQWHYWERRAAVSPMNPNRVTDAVHWEMEPGEKPVWFGRPEVMPYIRETTRLGQVLMGIPFAAVGSVLVPVAIPFGVLFVAIGICLLGTPVWNYLRARNTIYVVTNRRLIVIEQVLRQSVTCLQGEAIERVERRENRCGIGTLIFSRVETQVRREDGVNHSMVDEKGFFGIRNVGEVWRLIMDLKNQVA